MNCTATGTCLQCKLALQQKTGHVWKQALQYLVGKLYGIDTVLPGAVAE